MQAVRDSGATNSYLDLAGAHLHAKKPHLLWPPGSSLRLIKRESAVLRNHSKDFEDSCQVLHISIQFLKYFLPPYLRTFC